MLTGILLLITLSVMVQAQSYTGTYQMVGIKVGYHNLARAVESAGDSVANYYVEAKWPNAATPVYSHILAGYAPGDTIIVVATPDLLLTPAGLEYVGIDLSVALDMDGGRMLIPAVEGTSNTFPTTTTENCSSFAVVSPVNDNALISSTYNDNSPNSAEGDYGTFTWGFGIAESVVFDWFVAPQDWDNPSGLENFGQLKGFFNESGSGFDKLEVSWHAVDGQGSDSGIDDDGKRDRFLGIPIVPGDTVTTAYLASIGLGINVGSHPILGGEGLDLDGDGEPDGVVKTDWGYLFDPKGADDVMMSGDEPLQFTGYYFTYNFLSAIGLFEGLFEFHYGTYADLQAAFIFAADSTLRKFGAPATFSTAVVTALSDSLTTWIAAGVAAYMAEGMDQTEATLKATEDALQAGMLKSIGGTALYETPATDLFFSEYIEGGSYNKALEIYNGTGAAVDLTNYLVLGNYNGNPFSDTLRFPAGTMINSGDVYVIVNEKASTEIIAEADTIIEDPYAAGTSFIASFNGDDVRGLFKIDGSDTTCIDLFGFYDLSADTSADPGSGWDVAGITTGTKDHTLVRKPTVKVGNTDWTASAGTDAASSEWVVLAKDSVTELGKHIPFTGWTFPNDSDHDYDGTSGRLVFQIGNSCVPSTQIRDVHAIFDNFTVGIESEDILPAKFAVHENYPNPFNPITNISFDLPEFSPTEVTVWNLLGQQVATLFNGELPAGRHTISFDARNENGNMLPSGIYIYRVEAGNKVATKKMMLLK